MPPKNELARDVIKGGAAIFAMGGLSMNSFDGLIHVLLSLLAVLIGLATLASYYFRAQRERRMLERMEIDDANRKDRDAEIRRMHDFEKGNPK